MRAFVFCLALLAPVSAHAAADVKAEPQTAAGAAATAAVAPAGAGAGAVAPAAAAATSAGLSLDTPIGEIAAAPAGKAVLDQQLPGLLTHPAYETFKAFSLKALQPYSNGLITDELLAAVEAGLKAITPAG